jgi:hypothetical protein
MIVRTRRKAGLDIRDIVAAAVIADQHTSGAEMRPGEARKQMMLDLVVQPTHQDRGPPAAGDVARRTHLLAEKVGLDISRDDRHAFVIRREGRTHVEAEDSKLQSDESPRQPNGNSQKIKPK